MLIKEMEIQDVERILEEEVLWVDFNSRILRKSAASGCMTYLGDPANEDNRKCWGIDLRADVPEVYKRRDFIHEIAHIYFGEQDPVHLDPFLKGDALWKSETFLDEQADWFCHWHWDYVDQLYERYQNSSGKLLDK